jgi:hypothetical protein
MELTAIRSCSWSLQTKCLRQAITSVSWMPLQYAPASVPESKGSSEYDSKPLPPRGPRWMLIVGPRTTCAPLAFASSARRLPMRWARSLSKVAPMAVPQGKHADGVLPKKCVPRMPLGPSEVRMEGISSRGISWVCQKSFPVCC